MSYEEQIALIYQANGLDFEEVVYPAVVNSDYDPVDKTDILVVIKDFDMFRYNYMDTLARDNCIEIIQRMLEGAD